MFWKLDWAKRLKIGMKMKRGYIYIYIIYTVRKEIKEERKRGRERAKKERGKEIE